MDKKVSPKVSQWGKTLKKKMVFSRLAGLLFCLLCLGSLALMYFKIIDRWMCLIMISFLMACIFISNSYLQGAKLGRKWQAINLFLALICYAAVITFITIAFMKGTLTLGF